MTTKEMGCVVVSVVAPLLIVDSQLCEHPMQSRPEPHNVLGHFVHGKCVRGAELAAGIVLILGTIGTNVAVSRAKKMMKIQHAAPE